MEDKPIAVFGYAYERDKELAHAAKLESSLADPNRSYTEFQRARIQEWIERSLNEACRWDGFLNRRKQ